MRKLLLAAAVLLVSATAYAADPPIQLAANDSPQSQPAATAVEPAKVAEPAKPVEPAKAAEPAPVAQTTPVQGSKPKQHTKRRESGEHKARRIDAKYGVYW